MGGVVSPELQEYHLPLGAISKEVWQANPDTDRDRVDPRNGLPGIPIRFSFPEEVIAKMYIPGILIRREDINPAMNRWHPGMLQFRGPAEGAQRFSYSAYPTSTPVLGWDKMEERQQAVPCDISYTIQLVARNRGAPGIYNQANRIFDHLFRKFPPYSRVLITDSVGDLRSYDAYMESIGGNDDNPEVTDRMIGYAFTIRVEGELDHLEIERYTTVRSRSQNISRR